MSRHLNGILALLAVGAGILGLRGDSERQWKVHDQSRPQPPVVTPGHGGSAPSDAIVLFDGQDLSQWVSGDQPPTWHVADGYMEVRKGGIRTRKSFGSCQLHLEWATPSEIKGEGQGRGNSGVFLMDRYELQILDSHQNQTYPDGQAASIYGQNPPLVNACRPAGEWQSYDIVFRRPKFDADGKVTRPATITALHNGVLVQDHFTIWGRTAHKAVGKYEAHGDTAPLSLQDHGNPMRFRNVWIRPLED